MSFGTGAHKQDPSYIALKLSHAVMRHLLTWSSNAAFPGAPCDLLFSFSDYRSLVFLHKAHMLVTLNFIGLEF